MNIKLTLLNSLRLSLLLIAAAAHAAPSEAPARERNPGSPTQPKSPAVFDFLSPSAYGKFKTIEPAGYFALGTRYVHPPRAEWRAVNDIARYELLLVQNGRILGVTPAATSPAFIQAGWNEIECGKKAAVIIRGLDAGGELQALSGMIPFYVAPDFDRKVAASRKRPYRDAAFLAFQALWDYRLPVEASAPKSGPGAEIHQALLPAATGPRAAYAYSFPVLHDWIHAEMCRALDKVATEPPLKKRIRDYARSVGQHLLMCRILDEGYVYRGLIRGCADYNGKAAIGIGAEARAGAREDSPASRLVEPSKNGYAGRALVRLYELTEDRRYLEAAAELAEVLARTQLPDGSWPARADAKTGEVITEYSSSVIAVATFLDELNRHHADLRHVKARDRAVRWAVENPATTWAWVFNFDDGGAKTTKANPFGSHLSNFDLFEFVRYLASHPDAAKGAAATIREQLAWNDNHFTFYGDDPLLSFNPFYPSVGEQNNPQFSRRSCWCPMDFHTGNWALANLAAFQFTKDRTYLDKAQAGGNTLTQYQMDNGATLTWMPDARLGISYRADVGMYRHAFWPAGWAMSAWTWAELERMESGGEEK